MDDLISRQAAIDVIDKIFPADPMRNDYTQGITCGAALAEEYIKQLPSAQPEIVRCRDCKHFDYNHPYIIQGVPVLGHEVCNAWGDGCKTDEDGYCFLAERRTDERSD